jgi:hypothetical protein
MRVLIRLTAPIKIIGASGSQWFLNGQKVEGNISQMQIPKPGLHNITARNLKCSQTNEFFVQFE